MVTSLMPAFSTLGCPGLDLDEVAALAAATGIRRIELRALDGTADLPGYFAGRYGTPAALAEDARQLGVAVAGVGTSLRLIGGTGAARDAFLAYVPWAIALAAPYLRVFDGGSTADDAELADAGATLLWWDRVRQEHGWPIDVMIETHDALAHPDSLQRFIDRNPGRAILWDAHHTWRTGNEDPAHTWQRVRDAAVHIHVKDSVPNGDPPGCTYVPMGQGGFPMPDLLRLLEGDGFAGPVSLEWERLWHPELAPLQDVLPAYARLFAA